MIKIKFLIVSFSIIIIGMSTSALPMENTNKGKTSTSLIPATVYSQDGTIGYKEFRLLNNKWGQPNAYQSIFSDGNGIIGWSWSNPGGGYNYPEIVIGTDFGTWNPSTYPLFPIQYGKINNWTVNVSWSYTRQPTDNWWDLGFDIYWMNSYLNVKYYNIMIWLQNYPANAESHDAFVKDVNDTFNTYEYYHDSRREGSQQVPWDCFILKNQSAKNGSIKINIKALTDNISTNEFYGSGSWYIPDIQFGNENTNGIGAIYISQFDMNINNYNVSLNRSENDTISASTLAMLRNMQLPIYPTTPTPTPIPTDTLMSTSTPTPIPTDTLMSTDTPMPTSTPTPIHTDHLMYTDTPMPTSTPTPIPTDHLMYTDTPMPTSTPTPIHTDHLMYTDTPMPTSTPTPIHTDTPTPTPTPTPIHTDTPTPTPTPTPIHTDTPTPTPTPTPIAVISGETNTESG
jgi:hypothetical protein